MEKLSAPAVHTGPGSVANGRMVISNSTVVVPGHAKEKTSTYDVWEGVDPDSTTALPMASSISGCGFARR